MMQPKPRTWVIVSSLFVISTCAKVLLFPAYRSTDFDVHRHWKAVTKHLALRDWYFDDEFVQTRHTTDYPPAFLWLEAFWVHNPLMGALLDNNNNSNNNRLFGLDDECFALRPDPPNGSLQTVSDSCIAFMRGTVIVGDFVLWVGAYAVAASQTGVVVDSSLTFSWPLFVALVLHPALFWLDHVHFQYNGLMIGIWLLSLACVLRVNNNHSTTTTAAAAAADDSRFHILLLASASLFALVLSMKHLYLTLAPWYAVYLFRRYCFVNGSNNKMQFSWHRLFALAAVTITTVVIPVLPFVWSIWTNTTARDLTLKAWLLQVARRLFPFGRGLVHDYWAGNLWAFYAAAEKVLGSRSSHWLPVVTPAHTALLVLTTQLPGLYMAWKAAALQNNNKLLQSLAFCGAAAFFGSYHVHEKAILNTLVPLTIWAVGSGMPQNRPTANDAGVFLLWWECTAWGTLGLVPLLFEPREMLLKGASLACYLAAFYHHYFYYSSKNERGDSRMSTSSLSVAARLVAYVPVRLYALALLPLVWIQVDMIPIRVFGRWEFVPLALTSLSCATGLLISFTRLAYHMMVDE